MSSTILGTDADEREEQLGGQMSFLEHLDELRSRIIRSIVFVFVAFLACWFVSDDIYNFLSRPILKALADAQSKVTPLGSVTGEARILSLSSLQEGDVVRYAFGETTRIGEAVVPAGVTVMARTARNGQGQLALATDEPLVVGSAVLPRGVWLPADLNTAPGPLLQNEKLVVTTTMESFSLYVKVSLYAAICLSVPFLLWQIWAFVSPGLYPHERRFALPFVLLSSISFVAGSAFAYYVIFPPAVGYLLGLGQDFRLLLNATDYFDFIILIMLGMGVVFQMPAITYVLARIGLVTAGFLLRVWKIALIVILVAAAVLSPTGDVPNMMLFAAPMAVLYLISIFVAWLFGQERTTE
jgi:sec-independent protein translocase protein TatC